MPRARTIASFLSAAVAAAPAGAQCEPHWATGFAQMPSLEPVAAVTSFQGDLVFATNHAPDPFSGSIARWDGTTPTWIGSVTSGTWSDEAWVTDLLAFDHLAFDIGSGPRLVACGRFDRVGTVLVQNVAVWNGSTWAPFGYGLGEGGTHTVRKVCIYDDGAGPRLFAGGTFPVGSGSGIARLEGQYWHGVGGASYAIDDLCAFDDGTGPALFAAGFLGASTGYGVARWNGSWTVVGAGPVQSLAVHDDGTGPALYAAGSVAGVASGVARWNGAAWSAVGSGFDASVRRVASYDDGTGSALYALGSFTQAGGVSAPGAARWNGTQWSALAASGVETVDDVGVWDDGSGASLCAVGESTGGASAGRVRRFRAGAWSDLVEGRGLDGGVVAFARFDDGGGEALYAGGGFHTSNHIVLNGVARWSGSDWQPLGTGIAGVSYGAPTYAPSVDALVSFDDGAGAKLYAGGNFTTAGSQATRGIARWNGSSWEPLAGGSVVGEGYVDALVVHDDGNGPALYAGGNFARIGSAVTKGVARWDGTSWSALGPGLATTSLTGGAYALASWDDGSGPALYVGGSFQIASVQQTGNIARWRNGAWSALRTSGPSSANDRVRTLAVLDTGSGPRLWIGGRFNFIGTQFLSAVATFDGVDYSAVGAGFPWGTGTPWILEDVALHDAGAGREPEVYATGFVDAVDGVDYRGLARWDGSAWWTVGAGLNSGHGHALASYDDGSGPSLWVGGSFLGEHGSRNVARLDATCVDPTLFCFGDGSAAVCPCGNASAPGAQAGCANSQGLAGTLRADGFPSLSADTVVLAGGGMPNSSALYFHGANVLNGGAGVTFGDGVKCTSGPFIRLATKSNVANASSFPGAGDPSLSVRGHITTPGTRHYQVRYRNAAAFCTSETFNYTNAVTIQWAP